MSGSKAGSSQDYEEALLQQQAQIQKLKDQFEERRGRIEELLEQEQKVDQELLFAERTILDNKVVVLNGDIMKLHALKRQMQDDHEEAHPFNTETTKVDNEIRDHRMERNLIYFQYNSKKSALEQNLMEDTIEEKIEMAEQHNQLLRKKVKELKKNLSREKALLEAAKNGPSVKSVKNLKAVIKDELFLWDKTEKVLASVDQTKKRIALLHSVKR